MHPVQKKKTQTDIDINPFKDLKISDPSVLDSIEKRVLCKKCKKSRKYFCYICYIPVPQLEGKIPQVDLPIKIDIIKHRNEIDGKSTSAHAAILAPNDIKVYTYPLLPDFNLNDRVILVYPSSNAKTIREYFCENSEILKSGQLPFTRAIFIDSTWNQSKKIYSDKKLSCLNSIILKSRISQFWRHQKNSPRWYLATIEAIHQLLVEITCEQNLYHNQQMTEKDSSFDNENSLYNGQYDNLLFFFYYMYLKIHKHYNHDSLLSYKRPLI